jgi:hypothetical protein
VSERALNHVEGAVVERDVAGVHHGLENRLCGGEVAVISSERDVFPRHIMYAVVRLGPSRRIPDDHVADRSGRHLHIGLSRCPQDVQIADHVEHPGKGEVTFGKAQCGGGLSGQQLEQGVEVLGVVGLAVADESRRGCVYDAVFADMRRSVHHRSLATERDVDGDVLPFVRTMQGSGNGERCGAFSTGGPIDVSFGCARFECFHHVVFGSLTWNPDFALGCIAIRVLQCRGAQILLVLVPRGCIVVMRACGQQMRQCYRGSQQNGHDCQDRSGYPPHGEAWRRLFPGGIRVLSIIVNSTHHPPVIRKLS